jgi:hypothetical protein
MGGPKFSIAVSGTTVCVGGDKIEFFTTSGSTVASFWRQFSGEPDTCSTPNGVIIRAHPSIANTFIAVGPNYTYTDSGGSDYTQNYFAWHVTTYGTPVQYTIGSAYAAPAYGQQTQNVVVTSTHIYYAYDYASSFTYLVRFTIGSAGSVVQSSYQPVYQAQTRMLWQRSTDSSWWAGMTGNRQNPPAPTALVGWTSALANISQYNVLSWGGFAIAGIALTDGSFLLGNVANNITDKYLDKTVIAPETGATIWGPPQSSGGGSTSSTSTQTYKTNTTLRLQKLANGNLLVAQRNTPFFN